MPHSCRETRYQNNLTFCFNSSCFHFSKTQQRQKPDKWQETASIVQVHRQYGHRILNKKLPITECGHLKVNMYSKPAQSLQLILQPQGSLPEEGDADLDCSCDLSCLCSSATWWAEQAALALHESCRVNPGGNQHISSLAWLPWRISHATTGYQETLSHS